MNLRKSFAVVVFLVTFALSTLCVYAQDGILIEAPLTWSINSIQIVWSIEQGATVTQEAKYIYGVEQDNIKSTGEEQTTEKRRTTCLSGGFGGKIGGGMEAETGCGKKTNPLASFELIGAKANASAYVEGGFNYNQTRNTTNSTQWSEMEKNVVSQALTLAYDQSSQQSISNQRLVFTVDFVNHTSSRLFFNSNSANTIPVYSGNIHIGDAHLINENASIAATGKPIPCQFAMTLNDTGKQSLVNNRPIIRIEGGQLLVHSDDIVDAIQESTVATSYFTVAILADNNVKEWKIRWFRENPITLQNALEVINNNIRNLCNDGNKTLFVMENDSLVSVCGVPFTNIGDSDWIAQLKVFKGGAFQIVSNPDSCLSETPCRGERYVFQLVSRNIVKLAEKAESGDAEALFELAKRYYLGAEVPEDNVKSMELLHKAAQLGYAAAQNSLGERYYNGDGVKQNKSEAVKWYRKAAEERRTEAQSSLVQRCKYGESLMPYLNANIQGLAAAQYNLGKCYYYGEGVGQDYAEAVIWYRKAAKQGHAKAQETLAFCCIYGKGVEPDKAEAVKWYRKAAEQGIVSAQYSLGVCYHNGDGVKQDKSEAVKWYRKAAEQGYLAAQLILGRVYDSGSGIPQNHFEAAKWYRKAAEQGSTAGQNNLGKLYESGKGVKQSFEEAVKWYRKAADQGDSKAQYNLGQCCQYGKGVEQSYKEAAKWYRKAAEQGDDESQFNLAQFYYNGNGVEQDYKEAAYWYRKAADQRHAEAAYCLGWCYIYGRGVSMDLTEAENLLICAADRGHKGAERTLTVMSGAKVCGVAAATVTVIIIVACGA